MACMSLRSEWSWDVQLELRGAAEVLGGIHGTGPKRRGLPCRRRCPIGRTLHLHSGPPSIPTTYMNEAEQHCHLSHTSRPCHQRTPFHRSERVARGLSTHLTPLIPTTNSSKRLFRTGESDRQDWAPGPTASSTTFRAFAVDPGFPCVRTPFPNRGLTSRD